MTLTKNMFNEIKASLTNKTDSSYKDILKFEPGKTYLVRLVPNVQEPRKTIYHYYHHSWNSLANGQFVTALCPSTYGESCPIDSYVLKTYNVGTREEKEKIKPISRKENWLVNAYVISDPTNPENEGKVKVIRYGKELAKIINSAIDGDEAAEFGFKVFDVQNGCTLKVKCESRSGAPGMRAFVSYTSSKFMAPSNLEGMDDKKLETAQNSILELEKFFKPKTQAELQRMLDQHYFCTQDLVTSSLQDDEDDAEPVKQNTPAKTELDSIFEGIKEGNTSQGNTPTVSTTTSSSTDSDTDAKLKQLLESL